MFFLIRHNSSSSFLLSLSQRTFARWNGHNKCFSSIKTDYYKILGVNNSSTQEQIKKEFHRLAKLHHPDSAENQGDNEKFKEISEAYNVLGDAEKRVKYDSDLNLEKQRQAAAQQQHHQHHTHGFSQSGSHSSHNNHHFHKHHEFKRRHQQHDENNEEFRTSRQERPDGFDGKDDFGERQSIWANLRTVPELWLIAGLFGMLVMRWIYLAHSPNQRGKITMDPFDDDFEVSADRKNKKIELKLEDVHGMSLAVLDQIDSTGKYELPPKVKASVEEYRSLMGKTSKKDGQLGENQQEQGNMTEIQNGNSQAQKQKKEELGNDKHKENDQEKSNPQTKETIQQLRPVDKTEIVEQPKKSRGFNYAQRFNQKDKGATTTIPEKNESQVSISVSNQPNQTVIVQESLENKDQIALEQQRSKDIIQQRQQRQYDRQKQREKIEEDQNKGWLPVNRESTIPSFLEKGQSQKNEKQHKNNGLQE